MSDQDRMDIESIFENIEREVLEDALRNVAIVYKSLLATGLDKEEAGIVLGVLLNTTLPKSQGGKNGSNNT